MNELNDLKNLTQKAIREIPKSWQYGISYIQKITDREILLVNALAILVGVVAGYSAIAFRGMVGFFQNLILYDQFSFDLVTPLQHVRGFWMLLIPPLGLLASSLLTRWFAREAEGHGIPEVIEAVMTRAGRMRKRVVAIKALASSITIASGGSLGREGPIVQIGAAAGSTVGQWFRLQPRLLKTLVGCGAAGAAAATFNTPIAGVILAIEIIVLELKTRSFVPLVISSVFATVISRIHLGNEPAFFVPKHNLVVHTELIFYFGLAILAGLTGVIFIRGIDYFERIGEKFKENYILRPVLFGLALSGVGYFYPEVFGVGYETMSAVLQERSEFSLLLPLIALKIIAVAFTLAGGGSGGVFAPSLYVGAVLGGAYGIIVNLYYPEMTSGYGAYALVGMAAVFAATSRATFTAIVILFEMTLDYTIILPLMFVCVLADQLAWTFCRDSIYSLKLKGKGLSFVNDIGVNVMSVTLLKDIMTTEMDKAEIGMSVQDAKEKLLPSAHTLYPLVNAAGELEGIVLGEDLFGAKGEVLKKDISFLKKSAQAVAYSDETVMSALRKIEGTRDPRILVVDRRSKHLVGIASPIDFVRLSSSEANQEAT